MNFATVSYLIFFVVVFAVYWTLSRRRQNVFLCLASYFFYACWDYRFLSLILASTLVDFVAGRQIHRASRATTRKFWLGVSLVVNLGALGFFKYFNFFADGLVDLAGFAGWHLSSPTLNIILPVGISFYTFQTMSYSLDIYLRKLEPIDSLIDFATFVAFFPQLVAGPIVRAREFVYQLESDRPFRWVEFEDGLVRILFGFCKKIFIADTLAVYLVDPVFANPSDHTQGALWLALAGYSVQIYADFSGYSNIAIGSAKLLGFSIPENFAFPYLSRDISEFWRRWHMTMSRFFRDYVYIALGGNRRGYARTLLNLAATTLVSGLWHGAGWTFVIWGGLHGVYLAINQLWRRWGGRWRAGSKTVQMLGFAPAWMVTQLAVALAWVLFRSPDLAAAHQYLRGLLGAGGTVGVEIPLLVKLAFVAFLIDHLFGLTVERKTLSGLRIPVPVKSLGYVALIIFLYHAHPSQVDPFIYFQF